VNAGQKSILAAHMRGPLAHASGSVASAAPATLPSASISGSDGSSGQVAPKPRSLLPHMQRVLQLAVVPLEVLPVSLLGTAWRQRLVPLVHRRQRRKLARALITTGAERGI
jgi:hypothetical protein